MKLRAATPLLASALGLAFGLGCTAILKNTDDDIQYCGNAGDCDDPGDDRYESVCKFDEANKDLDAGDIQKVCVAEYKRDVSCDLSIYTQGPLKDIWDSRSGAENYDPLFCTNNAGAKGCPGPCQGTLVANKYGVCDEPNAAPHALAVRVAAELYGKDLEDQFCRSFFCDERFVCGSDDNCVLCDESATDFAMEGCGQVYISGAPSCVYQDAAVLEDVCPAPDILGGQDGPNVAFGCQ